MTFGCLSSSLATTPPSCSTSLSLPPFAFAHRTSKRRQGTIYLPKPVAVTATSFLSLRDCGNNKQQRRKRPLQQQQYHHSFSLLRSSKYDNDDDDDDEMGYLDDEDHKSEEEFLKRELARLESLEELLKDIDIPEEFMDDDIDDDDVEELFSLLEEQDDDDYEILDNNGGSSASPPAKKPLTSELEKALLQGVVPVSAGVGSECLPGDWGFDPLDLSSKDYILQIQYRLLQFLPGTTKEPPPPLRPTALILRDYREAEIRHGRLAMLAAMIWPLQEMLDRLLLDSDQFGPLIFGPVTLPYFPLMMTLIMMLLGYLDIYAKAIQDRDGIGDAFLPGDCFWDPLNMLEGAPASMKRNMQERELFNGRVAMIAIAAYIFEEATTRLPVIEVEGNDILFLPAYQVPFIQEWLDAQFYPTIYN